MKPTFYYFLIFLGIVLTACNQPEKTMQNHFSSTSDTLLIQTTKQKGSGMFEIGASMLQFMKVDSVFPYRISYPEGIDRMERTFFMPDLQEKRPLYVDIVKGIQNGKAIVVVDENNNKNLTDDAVRKIEPMLWKSDKNVIPCTYDFFNGTKMIQDTSWLKIGTSNNTLFFSRSDHVIANINVDSKSYKIAIADPFNLSFSYDVHPKLAIIETPNVQKDSILHRDLLALDEFVQLNDSYYKFHHISKDGSTVTLIKEKDFASIVGTQIGMKAPKFTIVTTENDTIQSTSLQDKPTIVANSCGCGGDKVSTEAYYEMLEATKDMHILHVDSNLKTTKSGIHIDTENEFNKAFYQNYRKQYCSRICYVIGKDHRIIDKFVITNWETALKIGPNNEL